MSSLCWWRLPDLLYTVLSQVTLPGTETGQRCPPPPPTNCCVRLRLAFVVFEVSFKPWSCCQSHDAAAWSLAGRKEPRDIKLVASAFLNRYQTPISSMITNLKQQKNWGKTLKVWNKEKFGLNGVKVHPPLLRDKCNREISFLFSSWKYFQQIRKNKQRIFKMIAICKLQLLWFEMSKTLKNLKFYYGIKNNLKMNWK